METNNGIAIPVVASPPVVVKTRKVFTQPAKPSVTELQSAIAKLQAENAALKAAKPQRAISFRVSEKLAVSVYGLNARFPVTMYASQWEKLFAVIDELKQFIIDNNDTLARK